MKPKGCVRIPSHSRVNSFPKVQHMTSLRRAVSDEVAAGNLLSKGLAGDDLSDHGAEDSEHGSTALVDLNVELVELLLSLKEVGDERSSVSAAVVTAVVGGGPDGELADSAEEDNLRDSGKRNGEKSVDTVGDVGEADAQLLREVSGELNVGVVEKHTDDGNHGNTAVLALDGTTALEARVESGEVLGRVGSTEESNGVVQAKRGRDSDGGVKRVDSTPGLVEGGGAL